MTTQNKNQISIILTALICLCCAIFSVFAINNYFYKQQTEDIKLVKGLPIFEVNKKEDNPKPDKILLPIELPIFNKEKYTNLITIKHEAKCNLNGIEMKPLYLKITNTYDTKNTFNNCDQYFSLKTKVNNNEYSDNTKPKMEFTHDIGKLDIEIQIQQTKMFDNKDIIGNNTPKLTLKIDYELLDVDGNSFEGGNQIIESKMK